MPRDTGPAIMIVEDDQGLRTQLRWGLADYEVHLAKDRESALAILYRQEPEVVILDLGLPPDCNNASEGLATLRAIQTFRPYIKVIVASGNEDRANAMQAMVLGAYDYYSKPVDLNVLKIMIQRAWNLYKLEEEVQQAREGADRAPLPRIIAGSPEMIKVCRIAERVAASDVSVMITGESGTGKDLLARGIHETSIRQRHEFIAINCAAIPENLLESELFGHEKGAFTGAIKQVVGKIELAHQGTLFLDEIGDMPLSLQAKLLRFLQDRSIVRVGGRKLIEVDLRVIAATNKDLKSLMAAGSFREDLFYRLNEVGIAVPPLRNRPGDAVLVANHLVKKLRGSVDRAIKGFTPEALARIDTYSWPGNVRELENRIKRAIVLGESKYIDAIDLDLDNADGSSETGLPTLRQSRQLAECAVVVRALALTDNNIAEAARLLGVSRPTFYNLMKSFNIRRGDEAWSIPARDTPVDCG